MLTTVVEPARVDRGMRAPQLKDRCVLIASGTEGVEVQNVRVFLQRRGCGGFLCIGGAGAHGDDLVSSSSINHSGYTYSYEVAMAKPTSKDEEQSMVRHMFSAQQKLTKSCPNREA